MKYKFVVIDRDGEWVEVANNREEAERLLLEYVLETGDFKIKKFTEKFVKARESYLDAAGH